MSPTRRPRGNCISKEENWVQAQVRHVAPEMMKTYTNVFTVSRHDSPPVDDVDEQESPALASTPHHSPRPAPTGAEGRLPTKQFPIQSAARCSTGQSGSAS